MAILQLVDQMTELLNEGREVPLSRYRMVDSEEFSQMLERMRISVPSSIRESERTLLERDNILARARAEADKIVQEARDIAAEMLGENSLVVMARQEAHRIIEDGQEVARQRTSEADGYATQVLQELHEKLASISGQVENGIAMMTQQNDQFSDYSMPQPSNLEMRSMNSQSEPTTARRMNNPLINRTAPAEYGQAAVDNREYETPSESPQFDSHEFDNSGYSGGGFATGGVNDGGVNDGGFDNSRFNSNEFNGYVNNPGFDDHVAGDNYTTGNDYTRGNTHVAGDHSTDEHRDEDKPLQPPMLNYLADSSDPMSDHL